MDSYRKIAPKLPSNTTGDQPDARRTMNTESTSSAGAIEELGLSNVIETQITVGKCPYFLCDFCSRFLSRNFSTRLIFSELI